MFETLQNRYINGFQKKIEDFESFIIQKDSEAIRILGHQLHGSGASYGFEKITDIGKKINNLAKESDENKWEKLKKELFVLNTYIEDQKKTRGLT